MLKWPVSELSKRSTIHVHMIEPTSLKINESNENKSLNNLSFFYLGPLQETRSPGGGSIFYPIVGQGGSGGGGESPLPHRDIQRWSKQTSLKRKEVERDSKYVVLFLFMSTTGNEKYRGRLDILSDCGAGQRSKCNFAMITGFVPRVAYFYGINRIGFRWLSPFIQLSWQDQPFCQDSSGGGGESPRPHRDKGYTKMIQTDIAEKKRSWTRF